MIGELVGVEPIAEYYSVASCKLNSKFYFKVFFTVVKKISVENIGVEPMTSCLQSRRSSQLS
jgi:hypothetical protein